jgi:hypothetical protein
MHDGSRVAHWVIGASSFQVGALSCPDERAADAVEGVGLAERGQVRTCQESSTQVRAAARGPAMPVSRWLVNPWGTGGGCLPTSAAIRGVACSSIAGVPVLTSTTLLPAEARSSAPSPGDGRVVVFAHFDEVWEDSGLQVPAGRVQAGNP